MQGCHHDQQNIDALRALEDRGHRSFARKDAERRVFRRVSIRPSEGGEGIQGSVREGGEGIQGVGCARAGEVRAASLMGMSYALWKTADDVS